MPRYLKSQRLSRIVASSSSLSDLRDRPLPFHLLAHVAAEHLDVARLVHRLRARVVLRLDPRHAADQLRGHDHRALLAVQELRELERELTVPRARQLLPVELLERRIVAQRVDQRGHDLGLGIDVGLPGELRGRRSTARASPSRRGRAVPPSRCRSSRRSSCRTTSAWSRARDRALAECSPPQSPCVLLPSADPQGRGRGRTNGGRCRARLQARQMERRPGAVALPGAGVPAVAAGSTLHRRDTRWCSPADPWNRRPQARSTTERTPSRARWNEHCDYDTRGDARRSTKKRAIPATWREQSRARDVPVKALPNSGTYSRSCRSVGRLAVRWYKEGWIAGCRSRPCRGAAAEVPWSTYETIWMTRPTSRPTRRGSDGFDARLLREPLSVMPVQRPLTLSPGATVTEAMRAMQREHRGCVLVTDDGTMRSKLIGIFTERDVLFRIVDKGRNPAALPIGDVMTPEPREPVGARHGRLRAQQDVGGRVPSRAGGRRRAPPRLRDLRARRRELPRRRVPARGAESARAGHLAAGFARRRLNLFGHRPDADLVRDAPAMRRILPHVSPRRNDSLFYLPNDVEVEAALEFLDKHNRTRPPDRPATLFHLLLRAVVAGRRAAAGHQPVREGRPALAAPRHLPDVQRQARALRRLPRWWRSSAASTPSTRRSTR